ncbi:hypothetical protein Ahy_A07g033042 isoform D [Arachis hypogaea]|uniref:Uncharacterized protein n=1 Tax=Arachis hypogaea TaxID=3818 RepID=A0A445C826_ARAHY|nr:hypothetical protein Ahy_A07g033042 isoform D [Arachis hypogaea]
MVADSDTCHHPTRNGLHLDRNLPEIWRSFAFVLIVFLVLSVLSFQVQCPPSQSGTEEEENSED